MKNYFLLSLMALVLMTSCRSEDDLSIDPPINANIENNSTLAFLMAKVSLNDGSKDNMIDFASNLSVKLPVTVTVNGMVINVTNSNDYEEILDSFDVSEDDDDEVIISYPITVVFSDFSTAVINSDSELAVVANTGEDENDDDIECIDFEYPITASVFNENDDTVSTITINNDNQMYNFIEDLDEFAAVTINFPITVVLADGSVETINSVQELEAAIEAAEGTCDEDDNNDFDDCDTNIYTPTYFEDSILACGEWTIDKLKRNNNNLVDIYEEYIFTFNADGTLLVTENANIFNGTWIATETAGDADVTIDVVGLPDFNDTWNLCKINLQPVEKQVELKIGTDRLRFGSYCSDNTDATLEDILEDGAWIVASYSDDGIDETADYDGYEINFSDDGTVFATNGTNTNNGTWSVFGNDGLMALDFGTEMPFEEFNDNNWDVVSISNTEVTIHDVSGGNGNTDILTLQKL
ncbi:hypothetical protein [uncultured Winogradskyella sp.]|uniref:hypothetical protein n=1 Tax=uncultured Winogradskyella sp. TaxID=395353 RepID=UPI00260ECD6C|nr:hypothetical protein [uncultured Winogradskyella sp.]